MCSSLLSELVRKFNNTQDIVIKSQSMNIKAGQAKKKW